MIPDDRPGARARTLIALGVALAIWGAGVAGFGGLVERAEAVLLDARVRLAGPRPPPGEIVVVSIGERALAAAGGWPVERRFWAELVGAADRAGARTLVLDTLLEPRTARPAVAGDRALAAALAAHGRAVLALGVAAGAPGPAEALDRLAFPVVTATLPSTPSADRRLVLPPSVLGDAAAGLAPSLIAISPFGGPPVLEGAVRIGDRAVPTLAVEAVRVHRDIARARLWHDADGGASVEGRPLAPAQNGGYRLRPYGPAGTVPVVEALDLLAGGIDLAGRLVVMGVDAPAAGERFRTAFSPSLSGVELLATGIGNLLEGRTLRRLPVASGVGLALTLMAATAAAWTVGRGRPAVALATSAALVALWLAGAQAAFVWGDLWLPAALPIAALLLAAVGVEALRLVLAQRAERALAVERQNLARFFPPAVAERLAGASELATLDRAVDATVMFVDVVGSSAIVERLAPAAALAELRRFAARIEAIVFAEGGTLVSFLGDGALVAFGVPEPRPDAAAAALRAAHRLAEAFADDPWMVSIGLNHGPVVAGNVGGARQFQYSVTGDTVHVASRLEGLSRELDAVIVASAAVLHAAGDEDLVRGFRIAGRRRLRGRAGVVDVRYLPREPQRSFG